MNSHEFNTTLEIKNTMKDRKSKAKLIALLGGIWIIISLPLPWIINNPLVSESQFITILGIIGIMSIPFIALGIAWTLKPELTT
jgi:drug/metabolite transporter superfamily protein YnfA